MRQIELTVYCDACIAQGNMETIAESEAVSVKLIIGGTDPREMDLCGSCAEDFVYMSRPDKEKPKPKKPRGKPNAWEYTTHYGFDSGEDPTPWLCNYCSKQSKSAQGIRLHLSLMHKDRLPA